MNDLKTSSEALRARTWYSAFISEIGLNDAELAANKGEVSFAELHRRFVLPALPGWAQEVLLREGKRLRTLQNVRDQGFDPTAASVRMRIRDTPTSLEARARAEKEGQVYVLLPVNLIEATRQACPQAAALFELGVWRIWSTAEFHAAELRDYMNQTMHGMGLMRSKKVQSFLRVPAGAAEYLSSEHRRILKRPFVMRQEPWHHPKAEHLDLLAGFVAEATLFGDSKQLTRAAERLVAFIERAEAKAIGPLPYADMRSHVHKWQSACDSFIDQRFGPLAAERWSKLIRITDFERLVEEGRLSPDSASSEDIESGKDIEGAGAKASGTQNGEKK